jgi:hypothetical protein
MSDSDEIAQLQRERLARRLFAVMTAELLGSASVDRIFKKYEQHRIGESWLVLADLFLDVQRQMLESQASKRPDPEALISNVIPFKKPE